jgi:SAM-dependent methyltransferase
MPNGITTESIYRCRFCQAPLRHTFVDLGLSPLCETYITAEQLSAPETLYPLHSFVCESCFLVQLPEHVSPAAIFEEYAYFSSYSESWLEHAKSYAQAMTEQLTLGPKSLVIELASNDGYLLQYFLEQGVPVLGVEPARNIAEVAIAKGIPSITEFFGASLARELTNEGRQADLLLGNNVLAHVPDINDFVAGMKILLKPRGVITIEFPHLLRLIEENQFDTIYHEHFSYLSFITVEEIFTAHGLRVFDVEQLTTHGGSLRIHACHAEDLSRTRSARASKLHEEEVSWGVHRLERYTAFTERVEATRRAILTFLIEIKNQGETIAGYGAPGKGNTLLNYCGIRSDLLAFTVDRSTYKQGKFTPGMRIPIFPPEHIHEMKPDYVFILPWNLKDEIRQQMASIRDWGGKFVVPIPEVTVYD